jgi:hypothetical protein
MIKGLSNVRISSESFSLVGFATEEEAKKEEAKT